MDSSESKSHDTVYHIFPRLSSTVHQSFNLSSVLSCIIMFSSGELSGGGAAGTSGVSVSPVKNLLNQSYFLYVNWRF